MVFVYVLQLFFFVAVSELEEIVVIEKIESQLREAYLLSSHVSSPGSPGHCQRGVFESKSDPTPIDRFFILISDFRVLEFLILFSSMILLAMAEYSVQVLHLHVSCMFGWAIM